MDARSEQRRHPRISWRFMAKVRLKNGGDQKWQIPIIKNISEGGCFFIGGTAFETGQYVEMEIQFPSLPEPMRFVAMVVRGLSDTSTTPPVYRTAVEFIDMDENKKDKFAESIQFFLKKERRKE